MQRRGMSPRQSSMGNPMAFKKADKKQTFLRLALLGPAGSGKSFTALRIAHVLAQGGPICAIDTERKTLSKYAGVTSDDGHTFEFDVEDEMPDCDVRRYIAAIVQAEEAGYKVMVIDSLSHAWAGPGGILEFVDNRKGNSSNNNLAWREATPLHNKLVDTILSSQMHIVVTMRVKTEYVVEKDVATGSTTIQKVGLQPIQREGIDYEFDVICDMQNTLGTLVSMAVSKSRCPTLRGKIFQSPGANVAEPLLAWLSDGAVVQPKPKPVKPEPKAAVKATTKPATKTEAKVEPKAPTDTQPATEAPARPVTEPATEQVQAQTEPPAEPAPAPPPAYVAPPLPEQVADLNKVQEVIDGARSIAVMHAEMYEKAGYLQEFVRARRKEIGKDLNGITNRYCGRGGGEDGKGIGSVPADPAIYEEMMQELADLALRVSNQEIIPCQLS